jgi:hypothetical protein
LGTNTGIDERATKEETVGTGVSLFFIAIGAILAFAIDANTEGFNLDAIGVILLVIGIIGLLWSLVLADDGGPFRRRTVDDDVVVRRSYVDDDVVAHRDAVIVDEDAPVRRTVRRVYR